MALQYHVAFFNRPSSLGLDRHFNQHHSCSVGFFWRKKPSLEFSFSLARNPIALQGEMFFVACQLGHFGSSTDSMVEIHPRKSMSGVVVVFPSW
jgi:hypothetical protein